MQNNMNTSNKITWLLGVLLFLNSCTRKENLAFQVDKPASVAAQEVLDTFPDLKTYINRVVNPNFRFGVALSLSDYTNQGVMYRLANRNFDEIVLGYEMKHGAVVQADGSLALDNVNKLLKTAKDAGMSVYGHTLCWHANQNAGYLRSLIAPLTVTTPGFSNALDLTTVKAGSFTGWSLPNPGAGITLENGLGMAAGTKAIQLISSSTSSAPEALQLITPGITVVPGHKYEIVCYIKSSAEGQGRIAFEGLNNNTPKVDWMKTGTASETFTTSLWWKEIRFQVSDFTGNSIKLHFDLGYKSNITYYIDVNNIYVYDTQGSAVITNLINGGDFETAGAWGGWGNNSTRAISAAGQGYNGTGKCFVIMNPTATNYWVAQTIYDLAAPLNNGEKYNLSFYVKGSAAGIIRPEMQTTTDYSSNGFGTVNVTTDWQKVDLSATMTAGTRSRFVISFGEFAGTVYIDNIVLSSSKVAGTGSITVDKTAPEKQIIVGAALEKWIAGMVTNSKDYVKAWDVVNEPMDDGKPAELKTGVGRTLASDEFYWQDYLGKDYAVTAFKLAQKYGNTGDKLFINDYNLEYNLDKCNGLIAYVQYIESKGARVDGIGTQMHISISTDKSKITQMFQFLAATGKLIKISELDIGVGVKTAAATPDMYQAQAEMYKYVIDKYFEIIPAAQRYGITIWSPLDSPASSSWRADEPIGLWTQSYVRKLAYAYVAKSLAEKASK